MRERKRAGTRFSSSKRRRGLLSRARARRRQRAALGVVEQTLGNWVREHRAGTLIGVGTDSQAAFRLSGSFGTDMVHRQTEILDRHASCSVPSFLPVEKVDPTA